MSAIDPGTPLDPDVARADGPRGVGADQSDHVLVDRGRAEAEAHGHLLLAVAFEQAGQCLTESRRKLFDAGLGGAHERATDQAANLSVKEIEEALRARQQVGFAGRPVQPDDARGRGIGQ